MSWTNMMLDLASIPTSESKPSDGDETVIVNPEDEEMELRKSLRL